MHVLADSLLIQLINLFIALPRNAETVDQAAFSIIYPDLRHRVMKQERKEIRKFGGGISVEDPFFPLF